MQVLNLSFPISQNNSIENILKLCFEWRRTNRETAIKDILPIEIDFNGGQICYESHDEQIESNIVPINGDRIGFFKDIMHSGDSIWTCICTISKIKNECLFNFVMDYSSRSIKFVLPEIKKPYLFKLLNSGMIPGIDGTLSVNGKPTHIKNDEAGKKFTNLIIDGQHNIDLPILLVSRTESGGLLIDPNKLAQLMYGMAHVVIAPEPNYIEKCNPEKYAPYNGALACFEKSHDSPWIFLPVTNEDEFISIGRIFNRVRMTLLSKSVSYNYSYEYCKDIELKNRLNSLKEKNYEEFGDIIEEYEARIDEKNKEISKRDSQIQILYSQNIINYGNEQELYTGEITDTVLEELNKSLSNMDVASRRHCIVRDIVDNNPEIGTRKQKREALKTILKNLRKLDSSTKKKLKELGFEVHDAGEHPHITFANDARFSHGVPSTAGDSRSGKNLASELIKLFL